VAFNIGRSIRKQLYELCGNPLTRLPILNVNLTKIRHLTPKRIILLKNMANIDDDRPNNEVLADYVKLKGFGKWTHDACSILLNTSNTINLSTDLYIRKNLAIYLNKDKLTEKEAYDYILLAIDNQTIVCYFLWRLKPRNIDKVKNNEELNRLDFV